MAEVKFSKGSEEWMMFTDFWQLCQKYWQVESSDEYWESLIRDTDKFYEKYQEIALSRRLALSFIDTQDKRKKEGN